MMDVQVYTTATCGYCRAAKSLLQSRNIQFEEIDVSQDFDKRRWLVEQSGQRTVPQIFLKGVPIGGFTELSALDRSGALAAIMKGEQAPEPVAG